MENNKLIYDKEKVRKEILAGEVISLRDAVTRAIHMEINRTEKQELEQLCFEIERKVDYKVKPEEIRKWIAQQIYLEMDATIEEKDAYGRGLVIKRLERENEALRERIRSLEWQNEEIKKARDGE